MAFDAIRPLHAPQMLLPQAVSQPARAHRLTIACVAKDTRIETDAGHIPAQDLDPSMQIWSAAMGPVPVLRIAEFWADPELLAARPDLSPLQVTANSLGVAAPATDLVLAGAHAIQLDQTLSRRFSRPPNTRVPAQSLTDIPGVRLAPPDRALDYVALLLDGAHVVRFNWIPCETFAPQPSTFEAVFGLSLNRAWGQGEIEENAAQSRALH